MKTVWPYRAAAGAFAAMTLFAGAGNAQNAEFEIRFYLQPDSTGDNTLNKSVEIDDDLELTIEESRNEGRNRYIERDATPDEISAIETLIRERLAAYSTQVQERPDYPRIEVGLEIDSGAVTLEIEEHYPLGALPAAYLALQDRFFEDRFE